MPLASVRVAAPLPRVQLRAAPMPLRRVRQRPLSGGAITVAVRDAYWRRLADGARVSDRKLRLKEVAKWENEQAAAAAAEHLAEHGSVEQGPSHNLDKSTLSGVDNEPAPHHHDVPIVPARKVAVASPELPLYPPALRVKAPRIPAGILVTSVRAPTAPMALEGPIGTGIGVTAVLLLLFGLVALGRLAARWRDSRSPEQPLFRPPRYPRWWWLP